ncbi:MAG: SWIM zinc finger family protein [Chloroflexi bacterium]|nr:SWIM zinc finger family protein [Chloroflexota bacterium]
MDNAMIGKIEKAKRYAEQPDRVEFTQFQVIFHGENDEHHISYDNGQWTCSCSFFHTRGVCSHTMALEKLIGHKMGSRLAGNPTPIESGD